MANNANPLRRLLPRGSMKRLRERCKVSRQTVYLALEAMNPTNHVVVEALRIIRAEGSADVLRELNELKALTQQPAPAYERVSQAA